MGRTLQGREAMKRPCSKCGIEKKFSDFPHKRHECRDCCAARSLARYHERLNDLRTCKVCGVEKELREFHISHRACKECRAEKRRGNAYHVLSGDEKLKPIDLVACHICSLRGHEPGDPDRCRQPLRSSGLGQQLWVGRGIE